MRKETCGKVDNFKKVCVESNNNNDVKYSHLNEVVVILPDSSISEVGYCDGYGRVEIPNSDQVYECDYKDGIAISNSIYKLMKDDQFFDFLNDVPDQFKSPTLTMKLIKQVMYMHMNYGIRKRPLGEWASKIMDMYNTELIETIEVKQKLESLINE